MLTDASLIAALVVYVLVARGSLALDTPWRQRSFAVVNVVTVAVVFYWTLHPRILFIFLYVGIVLSHWTLCRAFALRPGWSAVLPVGFPIAILVLVKYVPGWPIVLSAIGAVPDKGHAAVYFVGLSYVAFRLSHLVVEVRNGIVESPTVWEHLAYAFFPATMVVGPINPYSVHAKSLAERSHTRVPWRDAGWRVLVGLTKYVFAANILNQLSYFGLVTDGRPHPKIDWLVSAVFYYAYLYCNFSGFCDFGIGIAAMLGIEVNENFDRPFTARNIAEFWNRWHITLSRYMRDMVFTPMTKALVRTLGPRNQNHAIGVSIFTVFVLIGIWHGSGLNYLLFGVIHAIGVTTHHYYRVFLKRSLSPSALRAYHQNYAIHALSVCITFVYVTGSLAIFANDKGIARTLSFFRGFR